MSGPDRHFLIKGHLAPLSYINDRSVVVKTREVYAKDLSRLVVKSLVIAPVLAIPSY